MPRTALLLDFDGVIIKKNPLFPLVSNRCQRYIQRFTSIKNPVKAIELNKQLYDVCGHTVLGLQKMGYLADLQGFNQYIYGFLDYGSMRVLADKIYFKEASQLYDLYGFCLENKIDPYIFSNAPPMWINSSLFYFAPGILDQVKIISHTERYIKPQPHVYNDVESMFNEYDKIVFVDDKIINLLPVVHRPKWDALLLVDGAQDECVLHTSSKIGIVQDLSGVRDFLS